MKKNLIVFGLCAAASVFAQGPPLGRGPGRMGPGGPGGMMGFARTVTGAPYSGQEVEESTQTLANGNVITHKSQANVYRDSSGRVRMERTVPAGHAAPGQTAAQTGTKTIVSIHDPVAKVAAEMDTSAKTAHQMTLPNHGEHAQFQGSRAGRGTNAPTSDPNVVTTDLGMQTINGVQATGTRVTRTIPAGQIGNAQAIQVVTETWRSPDLQIPVMTKRTDPMHGTTTTQLTNITRSEPDPSLFQIPSDYALTQGHLGRGQAR
jgi:hypothetical protein